MQRLIELLREHALETAGVPPEPVGRMPELTALRKSERSRTFERLCSNRMVLGAFRYGLLRDATSGNRVGSLIERAKLYQQSGNLEHLCDIANLAMAEFVVGKHPKRHWRAADDEVHVPNYQHKPRTGES